MVAILEKHFSFEEYCQYDDGTDNRYELDNGQLIPMTPPKGLHFLVAQRLANYFTAAIAKQKQPWICLKEAGVRTVFQKSRIPDLMIVEEAKFMALLDRSLVFQEPPLLVVEIVSPESVTRDYRYKRSEYASLNVPEYWIVDPDANKVTVLIFNEGLYDETVFVGDEKIVSEQLPELSLTPQEILQV